MGQAIATYHEDDLWAVMRRDTGEIINPIHGPLAQILRKYPKDYLLRYEGKERE